MKSSLRVAIALQTLMTATKKGEHNMSKQNEDKPTLFEAGAAAMEIITLFASGGGSLPISQVVGETQECKPGYELQISEKYEQLPELAKLMKDEKQLEKFVELSQEQKREERDREIESNLLQANQPSISGGSPPNPESEDTTSSLLNIISSQTELELDQEFVETNQTVNQIISLIANSAVAEVENEQEDQPEGETEQNNETESTAETSASFEDSSEFEFNEEGDSESGERGE